MNDFQTSCKSNINPVLKHILIKFQKQVNSGELEDHDGPIILHNDTITIDKTKNLITNTTDIIMANDNDYTNAVNELSKIEDHVIAQKHVAKSLYQKIINYIYNYLASLIENKDINLAYAYIDPDTLSLTVHLRPIENEMPKNKEIDKAFISLLRHGFTPNKRRHNEEKPLIYTPSTYVYVNYQNELLFILEQDDDKSVVTVRTNQMHLDTSHFILNQQNNMPDKLAYFAKALDCIKQL